MIGLIYMACDVVVWFLVLVSGGLLTSDGWLYVYWCWIVLMILVGFWWLFVVWVVIWHCVVIIFGY